MSSIRNQEQEQEQDQEQSVQSKATEPPRTKNKSEKETMQEHTVLKYFPHIKPHHSVKTNPTHPAPSLFLTFASNFSVIRGFDGQWMVIRRQVGYCEGLDGSFSFFFVICSCEWAFNVAGRLEKIFSYGVGFGCMCCGVIIF